MNCGKNADFQAAQIQLSHEPDFSLGDLRIYSSTREARSPRGSKTVEPRVMQALVRPLGRVDRAEQSLVRCFAGKRSVSAVIGKFPFKNSDDTAHVVECLRLAGIRD